ncbi:MAG: D-tyrosyl-tRNA(Tyr) deacylase [Candidatus Altiarchaeota archaeon]|nr:D-tyrosyl-tRNA(Tyr) deacylase [Candidatus Altiarchaeota archaeon]
MKKLVVGSSGNLASQGIEQELAGRTKVKMFESSIVDLTELEKETADLILVASSHKSVSERPSLTAHSPGNWGTADFGGNDKTLSISPALYVSEAIRKFSKIQTSQSLSYEVSLEVTHHGPSFELPIVFIEVGSTEKQWKDQRALKAAADTIVHLLDTELVGESLIGVGGPHYAPKFTKQVLAGMHYGHLCPDYRIGSFDQAMLEQAIDRTVPRPEKLAIEWKGLKSQDRQKVLKLAELVGIEVIKI